MIKSVPIFVGLRYTRARRRNHAAQPMVAAQVTRKNMRNGPAVRSKGQPAAFLKSPSPVINWHCVFMEPGLSSTSYLVATIQLSGIRFLFKKSSLIKIFKINRLKNGLF